MDDIEPMHSKSLSSSTVSKLTLDVSPTPTSYSRQCAIVDCLAFSNGNWLRWCASNPTDVITETIDQIPTLRFYKTTRHYKHIQMNPRTVVVCAVIESQTIGVATWTKPISLAAHETLAEFIYRKGIEYKDALEDWIYPSYWINDKRRNQVEKAERAYIDQFLGLEKNEEMWKLETLAVHPGYQRRGVGGELVRWGLNQARATKSKVYVWSSPLGRGLYLKEGFQISGELILHEGEDQFVNICMLCDATN